MKTLTVKHLTFGLLVASTLQLPFLAAAQAAPRSSRTASTAGYVSNQHTRYFRFYYQFQPMPGWRVWSANGNEWTELNPDGSTGHFHFAYQAVVNGLPGIVVASQDDAFFVFIADRNSSKPWAYFRTGTRGEWSFLGEMHDSA